jgi:antitoxin FitA
VLSACYVTAMSNIQIKNVPEPLHAELRRRAEAKGETIRDYVLKLIEKDQMIPSKSEWFDMVAELEPVVGGESGAEAVRAIREERERELEDRERERNARTDGGPRDGRGR